MNDEQQDNLVAGIAILFGLYFVILGLTAGDVWFLWIAVLILIAARLMLISPW
jgi:uncharacterized membrane protein YecN with MAPEG domain